MIYFAWSGPDEEFDPDVHNTFDEQILSVDITHNEGDAATLAIVLKNPRVGPLSLGKWCWLSYDDGGSAGPQAIFRGRLMGSPADFQAERLTLHFRAVPDDYVEQKEALADSLRELPFYDPIWIVEGKDTPDAVLEARSAIWHVDRVNLEVSVSDVLDGEDGTIDISAAEHLYGDVSATYAGTPKSKIHVTGNIRYRQRGEGDVDLTTPLWEAFRGAGSPFPWPQVGSFTSPGLLADWPQPLDDLGGGWSVSATAVIQEAPWSQGWTSLKVWTDMTDTSKDELRRTGPIGLRTIFHGGFVTYAAAFNVNPLLQHLVVHYLADRERSETLTFTLAADIQPLLVDTDAQPEETLEFNSEYVDQGVEPDGSLPIVDARRNAYFPTDRGVLSAQYLMLLARAKLRFSARAVVIKFRIPGWPAKALALSCRKRVLLHDPRLPTGQALGKITSYTLAVGGGAQSAVVTIGCAVGKGNTLPAPDAGTNVYANAYAVGYTRDEDAQIVPVAGELMYAEYGGVVVDDDGVDLFNMVPSTVLDADANTGGVAISIHWGSNEQQALIDEEAARVGTSPDPINVLRDHPTQVYFQLIPVEGGAFHTDFPVTMEKLIIPQMVDLEAA